MTEKAARVEKLSAKLASAKKNTENTVRLIAYHKKMLKICQLYRVDKRM